jgi:hypothetical protein
MKLTIRPLTPDLWPALEDLFGENGAAGGCWCMAEIASAIETPWDMSMRPRLSQHAQHARRPAKRKEGLTFLSCH